MSSNLFEVMKLLESKRIHFTIHRSGIFLLLMASLPGRRIEISVDEDDTVDVTVFSGDESVEVGLDAVAKTIEDNE
jgi:hypothetical protein